MKSRKRFQSVSGYAELFTLPGSDLLALWSWIDRTREPLPVALSGWHKRSIIGKGMATLPGLANLFHVNS